MKFKNQSERPFRQDEQQFYLFHPPMPTENGKQLQEYFDERTKLENEKYGLWEEERKLASKFDNLSRNLMEVRRRETSTVEEEISKNAEIRAIQNQIHKIAKEEKKCRMLSSFVIRILLFCIRYFYIIKNNNRQKYEILLMDY